jgi:hypothetical protein
VALVLYGDHTGSRTLQNGRAGTSSASIARGEHVANYDAVFASDQLEAIRPCEPFTLLPGSAGAIAPLP